MELSNLSLILAEPSNFCPYELQFAFQKKELKFAVQKCAYVYSYLLYISEIINNVLLRWGSDFLVAVNILLFMQIMSIFFLSRDGLITSDHFILKSWIAFCFLVLGIKVWKLLPCYHRFNDCLLFTIQFVIYYELLDFTIKCFFFLFRMVPIIVFTMFFIDVCFGIWITMAPLEFFDRVVMSANEHTKTKSHESI